MEDNDLKTLITTFKEYRDFLMPIEQNLKDFSTTFLSMQQDIKNLDLNLSSNIKSKFDEIYSTLSSQAKKSNILVDDIEKFSNYTTKYLNNIDNLLSSFEKIEKKLNQVDEIQKKADEKILELENIIQDKKKTYDLKQLEKNLANYSNNVEKISEFINKDVAENINSSNKKLTEIYDKDNSIFVCLNEQKLSIANLIDAYNKNNNLLKNIVNDNDVNESYIFEILDKWADIRNVKIKK